MEIALWLGKFGIMCALVSGIEELGIRCRLQLSGKLEIRVKLGFLATEELVKLKYKIFRLEVLLGFCRVKEKLSKKSLERALK